MMRSICLGINVLILVGIISGCGPGEPDEVIEGSNGVVRVYHDATKCYGYLYSRMIPRAATDIRVWTWGTFGGQAYHISCKVSSKGLEEFARKHDYEFYDYDLIEGNPKHRRELNFYDADDPIFCVMPMVRDGIVVDHHKNGYIGAEKEYDGRSFAFLYDQRCGVLYVYYAD